MSGCCHFIGTFGKLTLIGRDRCHAFAEQNVNLHSVLASVTMHLFRVEAQPRTVLSVALERRSGECHYCFDFTEID